MKVYQNDVVDLVVAESPEDAVKVIVEMTGSEEYEEAGAEPWTPISEDKDLTVTFECEADVPEGATHAATTTADGLVQVTMAAGEWADCGRGFLGSTEY